LRPIVSNGCGKRESPSQQTGEEGGIRLEP
jgi:hypothetical protein